MISYPLQLGLLLLFFYQAPNPSITMALSEPQNARLDYQESETQMNAAELEALFDVMAAMAGDRDWRTLHPHPCSEDLWPGLMCEQGEDGLLHVSRLDFGYKPNPSCISNASLPVAITKLSSLRSLFIFECFTTMNTTIPATLQKLAPTLQELSLRANNALVGGIPKELAKLLSLELLSLSQNSLQGGIPTDLAKLTNLQHLDLSDNLLSGTIPPQLGGLQSLVILDLSSNSFTGSVPASLGNLTMLQKMDLSDNSLQGPLPSELGNLKGLQFLAANDNNLSGPFPPSLSNWVLLQYLILDNNPMNVPLPSFIGGFTSLMALSLSNSGYFGTIPPQLGSLGNLTVLSLEGNNLTGFIPEGLGQLPHIYQLNLSKNLLSGPVPFSLDFVKRLGRNLDLGGNLALCSHWPYPENISTGVAGLGLCSDPRYSAYLSSSASSPQSPMKKAALFCLLSISIILGSS